MMETACCSRFGLSAERTNWVLLLLDVEIIELGDLFLVRLRVKIVF